VAFGDNCTKTNNNTLSSKNVCQGFQFLAIYGLCGYSHGFPGTTNDSGMVETRKRQFSVLSVPVCSEPSEIRPALLCGDMQSLASISLTPKYVTLNDLEWHFTFFTKRHFDHDHFAQIILFLWCHVLCFLVL